MAPTEKREVPDVAAADDTPDSRALAESQAFANLQDLEKIEKQKAHTRRESFRDHYHRALVLLFWGFFSVLGLAGLIWAYHLLSPPGWHFLVDAQLDKIQSTFFTGVLSAGLAMMTKGKYLD